MPDIGGRKKQNLVTNGLKNHVLVQLLWRAVFYFLRIEKLTTTTLLSSPHYDKRWENNTRLSRLDLEVGKLTFWFTFSLSDPVQSFLVGRPSWTTQLPLESNHEKINKFVLGPNNCAFCLLFFFYFTPTDELNMKISVDMGTQTKNEVEFTKNPFLW